MRNFEVSPAWQQCHILALAIYRDTESFPKREWFGLTHQLRKAAYSAAANIAEGVAKRGSRELRRYLDISLGSLSEIKYGLILARDLGYLSAENWERLEKHRLHAARLTWRLYDSVARDADRRENQRAS